MLLTSFTDLLLRIDLPSYDNDLGFEQGAESSDVQVFVAGNAVEARDAGPSW